MTLQEILSEYDIEGKHFDPSIYALKYNNIDIAQTDTTACMAEAMAAWFSEGYTSNHDSCKGRFYFGPSMVMRSDDTGEFIECPDRKLISPEILSYWETRMNNAKNHILKARYAGLVWEFKTFVTGEKCGIEVARVYIKSLINIVNNDYLPHPTYSTKQAERAIKLSKQLGLTDLLNESKISLRDLILRHGDKNVKICCSAYIISKESHGIYTDDEQKALISDLKRRFMQIHDSLIAEDEQKMSDPWMMMDIADLLSGYYKKHSPSQIDDLFEKVEESLDATNSDMTSMQLVHHYQQLYRLVLKYGLKDKASRLSIRIVHFGKGLKAEMHEIKQEITIPKDMIDSLIDYVLQDNDTDVMFGRFTYAFIPKKERAKTELSRIANESPFIHMIPQSMFDDRGRMKASVGNIQTDLEGNLVKYISDCMKLEDPFLDIIMEEGKRKGVFAIDSILSFITQSPVIKEDRIPIIKRGLQAYFEGDYMVSIPLLIPQIEEIVRTMLEMENIPTYKQNKQGDGFQLRILDDMLRDKIVVHLLTDDFANYLRVLLTDNRGWNLRNDICHGIASSGIFNKRTANRVVHALLCFGAFRINIHNVKK